MLTSGLVVGLTLTFTLFFAFSATRNEVHGAEQGNCNSALGLQDGKIKDSQLSASSSDSLEVEDYVYQDMKAKYARLDGSFAWCSIERTGWLRVDLGKVANVTGIGTQGYRAYYNHYYVTRYEIQYSVNGISWSYIKENNSKKSHFRMSLKPMARNYSDGTESTFNQSQYMKSLHIQSGQSTITDTEFVGNKNVYKTKTNRFPAVQAQYIKIIPLDYKYKMCMRLELYGCFTAPSSTVPSSTILPTSLPNISAATTMILPSAPSSTVPSSTILPTSLPNISAATTMILPSAPSSTVPSSTILPTSLPNISAATTTLLPSAPSSTVPSSTIPSSHTAKAAAPSMDNDKSEITSDRTSTNATIYAQLKNKTKSTSDRAANSAVLIIGCTSAFVGFLVLIALVVIITHYKKKRRKYRREIIEIQPLNNYYVHLDEFSKHDELQCDTVLHVSPWEKSNNF